jgi:hypothetical protein
MSKKVNLDGVVRKESAYGKATEWMRKNQIYTKRQLVEFFKSIGKTERAAIESAVVMLSPRESSSRGDCRGNMSNPWGHLAYNDKLIRREVGGRKEIQRFRFRFRKNALEPRKRGDDNVVSSKKVNTEVVVTVKGNKVESS